MARRRPVQAQGATQTQKSPLAELLALESSGNLDSQRVLDTLFAALDKAILKSEKKDAARDAIVEGAAAPFTHNSRVGTQRYDLPVVAAQVWTRGQHNSPPPAEDAWSFTAARIVVEDHVRNAAYDTITRILKRPWRCIDVPVPEPPIDSILQGRPPYGNLRHLVPDPLWQRLRRALQTPPTPPNLHAFVGAPMVHFPLPRHRDDIPVPPEYVLLCVLPSNASLEEAAGGWPSFFPDQVPPPVLADLRAALQAEMAEATAKAKAKPHDATAQSRAKEIIRLHGLIANGPVSFSTAEEALKGIQAISQTGSSLRQEVEKALERLGRARRPRLQQMRILNDKNTARNVSGVLSGRSHLPMIRTDLPILGTWSPDRPINFAPDDERKEILRRYARLLRDGRKGNLTYWRSLEKNMALLMAHAFAPLEQALFCRLAAADAARGSIDEMVALLDAMEPSVKQLEAVVSSFVQEILSEISNIDRKAVGDDAQAIAEDLARHARQHLADLLSRHERRVS